MVPLMLLGLAMLLPVAGPQDQTPARPSPIPPGVSVVYVSSQRISNESAIGRAGQLRVQSVQRERATELRQQQQIYNGLLMQLAQAPAAERAAIQQKEQAQRSTLEQASLRAQIDTQNVQREVTLEIQARVKAVLDALLAGTDVQFVLQSEGAVVWAAPGLDLTDVVVERLNAGSSPDASSRIR